MTGSERDGPGDYFGMFVGEEGNSGKYWKGETWRLAQAPLGRK